MKPKIHVYDTVGLGLIINFPSGVMISNQTGGTTCLHPSVEGIYIPISNDLAEEKNELLSPSIDLENYFTGEKYNGTGATNGLDNEDVENVSEILRKYNLHKNIFIDHDKLRMSHEAWIYVKIKDFDLLTNFQNELEGILTWHNSD